jgi:hypothetical protein
MTDDEYSDLFYVMVTEDCDPTVDDPDWHFWISCGVTSAKSLKHSLEMQS